MASGYHIGSFRCICYYISKAGCHSHILPTREHKWIACSDQTALHSITLASYGVQECSPVQRKALCEWVWDGQGRPFRQRVHLTYY